MKRPRKEVIITKLELPPRWNHQMTLGIVSPFKTTGLHARCLLCGCKDELGSGLLNPRSCRILFPSFPHTHYEPSSNHFRSLRHLIYWRYSMWDRDNLLRLRQYQATQLFLLALPPIISQLSHIILNEVSWVVLMIEWMPVISCNAPEISAG